MSSMLLATVAFTVVIVVVPVWVSSRFGGPSVSDVEK
jgi:hypothetical protein